MGAVLLTLLGLLGLAEGSFTAITPKSLARPDLRKPPAGVSTPAAPTERVSAVREITSLHEWQILVEQCPTPAVVKFFQDGCRSCRALKPKYEAVAADLMPDAAFFEVNLRSGRAIFDSEQIRVAPSLHIYCGEIGRLTGAGFNGGRSLSAMRTTLRQIMEPAKLSELAAVPPAAILPPMRYVALVDALRAVRAAPRLFTPDRNAAEQDEDDSADAESPAPSRAPPGLSDARREEICGVFRWLDHAGSGTLGVDELVYLTRALTAFERVPSPPGATFAPMRLGASGIAIERAVLEKAVAAVHAESERACEPAVLDLDAFVELLALHDAEKRRRRLSASEVVNAAFEALDEDGMGAVPIEELAHRLDAFCRALPHPIDVSPEAIQHMLATLDFEGAGEVTPKLLARVVVRAAGPQLS